MSQQKQVRRSAKPFKSVEEARQRRDKLLDFRPSKDNNVVKFLARFFVPARLRNDFGVVDVKVSGLERLKEIKTNRCVLPFNHPSRKDPEVAFEVGLQAGEYFNFLAAREVFDERNGWMGRFMQWLGCWSVVRGAPDKQSFDWTVDLAVAGKQKIVIYQEGEINGKNDDPLGCEQGWIRLLMWALQRMESQGCLEPIYIFRVGTKFRYPKYNKSAIEQTLQRLEENLAITAEVDLYARLRAVCLKTLEVNQTIYKAIPKPGTALNDQITDVRNKLLEEVSRILNVEIPDGEVRTRVHLARKVIDERIFKDEDKMSPYERSKDRQNAEGIAYVYSILRTVQLFNDIDDSYVKETMTQERFIELLDLLELEHFGAISVKGESIAFVCIDEPINLLDWWPEYKKDKKSKKEVLEKLAILVSKGMRDCIQKADEASDYLPRHIIK